MATVDAAEAVQLVQARARTDAARALLDVRRQAERWGVERADRMQSRTPGTGEGGRSTFRVPLASRPLRSWYLHVYNSTLAEIFGRPTPPVTAADIETTAAEVGRLTPSATPHGALRITAVLAAVGEQEAVDQATKAYLKLDQDANTRAHVRGRIVGVEGVASDILQAWYQRCFRDATDFTIRDQPLRAVTAAEAAVVAQAVTAGQTRRIVGVDGIVVVTPHFTLVDGVDRRLAAGEVGVIDPRTPLQPGETRAAEGDVDSRIPVRSHATLAGQISHGWSRETPSSRRDLMQRAGIDGVDPHTRWVQLPWPAATAYIRHWLDTHRSTGPAEHPVVEQLDPAHLFERCEPLIGPRAAAQMFNLPTAAPPSRQIPDGVRSVLVEIANRRPQVTGSTPHHPPGHVRDPSPSPGLER